MRKRVVLSWSSGKDSAWTLFQLQQDPEVEVVALLTTVNEEFDRIAMHGVRKSLLELQAEVIGIPLFSIPLPWPCSNAQYESVMSLSFQALKAKFSPDQIAFGDLYLEDIRDYRVRQLEGTGLEGIFPLWKTPTALLSSIMIESNLKAILTCVDSKQLPAKFSGRYFDEALLKDLPPTVDPCGENGEFHTFVFDGPMFKRAIAVERGETVNREGFIYTDVLPKLKNETSG